MLSRLTKITVTTAAGAAAVLLAAGCSASSSPGSSHSSASVLSPIKAIDLAADQSRQVTSFSSTLDMQLSGESNGTISGTVQEETKPSVLMNVNMSTLQFSGENIPGGMQEILTSKDLYMKMSILQQELGKPWVMIPFSELQNGTGINFNQLVQRVQSSDPLVQTQMFSSATNVKAVGTQTIDGVPTTHYTGSYSVAAGIAKLPASMRSMVTTQLQKTGISTVHFNAWIDAQHQVRKVEVVEPGTAETAHVTMQITGIGQQVNITIPPKSDMATIPASDLKRL
jgi:LppX_LprAFG lipoprotein